MKSDDRSQEHLPKSFYCVASHRLHNMLMCRKTVSHVSLKMGTQYLVNRITCTASLSNRGLRAVRYEPLAWLSFPERLVLGRGKIVYFLNSHIHPKCSPTCIYLFYYILLIGLFPKLSHPALTTLLLYSSCMNIYPPKKKQIKKTKKNRLNLIRPQTSWNPVKKGQV